MTQQDTDTEESRRVIGSTRNADCADGPRAEPAHHDGVDDTHCNPTKLRKNNGNGERKERAQFVTEP